MKKNLLFLFLPFCFYFLFSCADRITGAKERGEARIEFSNCQYCQRCIDNFACPVHAIKTDPKTQTNYIDRQKCINCYRCLTVFSCPYNSFTTVKDTLAPAKIADLQLSSNRPGRLVLTFTDSGDDNIWGRAQAYIFHIRINGEEISDNEDLLACKEELPDFAGSEKYWVINNLPGSDSLEISLQVKDEADNISEPLIKKFKVQ